MVRIRSEGSGVEWIEIPEAVAVYLGTRPPYYDQLLFRVSHTDDCITVEAMCAHRTGMNVKIGSTYPASRVADRNWREVPQFLFDTLFKEMLLVAAH